MEEKEPTGKLAEISTLPEDLEEKPAVVCEESNEMGDYVIDQSLGKEEDKDIRDHDVDVTSSKHIVPGVETNPEHVSLMYKIEYVVDNIVRQRPLSDDGNLKFIRESGHFVTDTPTNINYTLNEAHKDGSGCGLNSIMTNLLRYGRQLNKDKMIELTGRVTAHTVSDIAMCCMLNRANLLMVSKSNSTHWYIFDKSWITVQILQMVVKGVGHAEPAELDYAELSNLWKSKRKFDDVINVKKIVVSPTCSRIGMPVMANSYITTNCLDHIHLKNYDQIISRQCVQLRSDGGRLKLEDKWGELLYRLTNKSISHWNARVSLLNVSKVISRHRNPIKVIHGVKYQNGVVLNEKHSDTIRGGTLILIIGMYGAVTTIACPIKEGIWLPLECNRLEPLFFLSLGTGIYAERVMEKKVILKTEKEVRTFLNNASLNRCHAFGMFTDVTSTQSAEATHLIVSQFDDRPHHMYNERDILTKYSDDHIIYVGTDLTSDAITWIRTSGKHHRRSLISGRMAIEVQTRDELLQAILNVLPPSWQREIVVTGLDGGASTINYVGFHNESHMTAGAWTGFSDILGKMLQNTEGSNDNVEIKSVNWEGTKTVNKVVEHLTSLQLTASSDLTWNLVAGKMNDSRYVITVVDSPSVVIERLKNLPKFKTVSPMLAMADGSVLVVPCGLILELDHVTGGQSYFHDNTKHDHNPGNDAQQEETGKVREHWDMKDQTSKSAGQIMGAHDWWNINKSKTTDTNQQLQQLESLQNIEGLGDLEILPLQNFNMQVNEGSYWDSKIYFEYKEDGQTLTSCDMKLDEDITSEVIEFWLEDDLTDHNVIYGPRATMTMSHDGTYGAVKSVKKTTLVRYPIYSRPVMTKMANQEINAVTGRIGSVTEVRKFSIDPKIEGRQFAETYFKSDWGAMVHHYRQNPLTFDSEKTLAWISTRSDSLKIAKELQEMLDEGLVVHGLDRVNVHLKLESLLKDEPITSYREQQARTIVWQSKAICAIFSPIFIEAKKRFKTILHEKFIYSDGLTPSQINDILATRPAPKFFLEDDLTKQDRQTDQQLLDCEFEIYRYLGVSEMVLSSWRSVHNKWRFKGKTVKGLFDAQRLTGQVTTALGNVIVNLLVHRRLVQVNQSSIQTMLVLGDDNLLFMSKFIDAKELRRTIADYYNMQSKAFNYENHGTFCSLVAYRSINGVAQLGPDYVRLRRRFEVTNGVSEVTDVNLEMRSMSYCTMLGDIPEARQIVQDKQWGLTLPNWYAQDMLLPALCNKYNMSLELVIANLQQLLNMIRTPKVYHHSVDVLVENR
uniref:RNA-dependent RNA polymerase n=1 Tax=Soybean leaf-associated endornavirus 1 TaxID=1719039 RepID=A0A0S1WF73_9VIRU|nr:RNA-dependent RNA polymerase [Soybean leaf-associated endornavirus 1]